jgi:2-C-methyl-D-erythritol 4-phosphate cytidylyltransferase/2-C-methyl-D-erythritol 2,4-cyclodiphosphate synthase
MKTIAIIASGGSGQRFSSTIPKQYINNTLTKTIRKFLSSNLIDSIQVVIRPEDISLYEQAIAPIAKLKNESSKHLNEKLLPPCFGGNTRSASIENALQNITPLNPELVLVHDANRPFLSINLINNVINQLKQNPNFGIVPSLPVSETIKRINSNRAETINRDDLITIQTPQGFYFSQLVYACKAIKHNFTDESTLMEANNIPVIYIKGEKENIKITYQEDKLMQIRSGIGFDAHRFSSVFSKENYITLGGIKIPFEKKLEAHSDGDVLIHALVDALLGCIGAGDIGIHFPPSDKKWKNANSEIFLSYTNNLLRERNANINNIDITMICEKPRLGEYRELMRNNIAQILNIDQDCINIKATTTEKMGFTGREEGIAVQAIATITLNA